jgi:hypothetical protein
MQIVVTVQKRWPTEGKGKGKVWGLGSTEGIRYGKVWALRAYRAQGVRCTLSLCVLWLNKVDSRPRVKLSTRLDSRLASYRTAIGDREARGVPFHTPHHWGGGRTTPRPCVHIG